MFDFPHVIEDGTPEEIKECLLLTLAAVPFEPIPVVNMRIVSSPVMARQQRLAGEWAVEWEHLIQSHYGRNAERIMAESVAQLLTRGMTVDERRMQELRFELETTVDKSQIRGRIRRAFFGKRKRRA
jgi:hypothetical protein